MGKMVSLARSTMILTVEHRNSIVVISNQKLSKDLEEWKRKIHLIAASVSQYLVPRLRPRPLSPRFSLAPECTIQNFRSVCGRRVPQTHVRDAPCAEGYICIRGCGDR